MKKRIYMLLVIAILVTGSAVFAEKQQIYPKSMTLNEYADWIEENIEPIEYEGIKKDRDINEWLYTGENSHTVYNGIKEVVGWLTTEEKWLVNQRGQVLDYVRLIYQVDFIEWSGSHSITHMYNLHGNGKVSFRLIY